MRVQNLRVLCLDCIYNRLFLKLAMLLNDIFEYAIITEDYITLALHSIQVKRLIEKCEQCIIYRLHFETISDILGGRSWNYTHYSQKLKQYKEFLKLIYQDFQMN